MPERIVATDFTKTNMQTGHHTGRPNWKWKSSKLNRTRSKKIILYFFQPSELASRPPVLMQKGQAKTIAWMLFSSRRLLSSRAARCDWKFTDHGATKRLPQHKNQFFLSQTFGCPPRYVKSCYAQMIMTLPTFEPHPTQIGRPYLKRFQPKSVSWKPVVVWIDMGTVPPLHCASLR